jgi:hypothetical protein
MTLADLQRLADKEHFSLRVTYQPKGADVIGSWGITLKPLTGSVLSFRVPRKSDHIHYSAFSLRDAIEQVVLHHYEDFELRLSGRPSDILR